jgi:TonB-dependent receptor
MPGPKHWGIVAVILAASVIGADPPAFAAETLRAFNIPSESLPTALKSFAAQANIQLLFDPASVENYHTSGAQGRMTTQAALQTLLKDSPLQFEVRSGVFVITRPSAPVPITGAKAKPPSAVIAPEAAPPAEIVVTGVRLGATSARNDKRDAAQIRDTVYADQIGKLPDSNVAEAVQRITGVQITRVNGSGVGVQVRGLTQVLAELNGRPIFSAGINNEATPSRTLNFEDLPSELVAKVEIDKSPTADQVEGGVGGIVNFRTQRPLQFQRLRYGFSFKGTYSDLAKMTQPSYSAFLANRWDTSAGPLGLWLAYSSEQYGYRTDTLTGTAPTRIVDTIYTPAGSLAGGPFAQPAETVLFYGFGVRKRRNFSLSSEWQPSPDVTFGIDINRSENVTNDRVEDITLDYPFAGVVNGGTSVTLANQPKLAPSGFGLNFPAAATINMTPSFAGFFVTQMDVTTQVAIDARFHHGPWVTTLEAYSDRSHFGILFDEVSTSLGTIPVSYDFRAAPAEFSFSNTPLLDLSQYRITKLNFARHHDLGTETAFRADAERQSAGPISKIQFGVRLSERFATFQGNNPVYYTNIPTTGYESLFHPTRYSDALAGDAAGLVKTWMVANPGQLVDPDAIASLFKLGPLPDADPRQTFDIHERAYAAYARVDFNLHAGTTPVDGNAGVRVVSTTLDALSPDLPTMSGSAAHPNPAKAQDVLVLPSLNARITLTPNLFARLAASKTVARPEFSQLNPTLFIVNNFGTATGGNPYLKSLKADQFDASLEYYFSKTSYVSAGAFYKSVFDFPEVFVAPETVDGRIYQVSRTENAAPGRIEGAEFAYQQFYDFLPAPFDGLGVNANATFMDSTAPDGFGGKGRLPMLSKTTYNFILMYEKKRLSARLAYNWRSDYPVSYTVLNNQRFPTLQGAYGQLDAALNYAISNHYVLTLEATNLRNPITYQSTAGLINVASKSDRRWMVGLRYRN